MALGAVATVAAPRATGQRAVPGGRDPPCAGVVPFPLSTTSGCRNAPKPPAATRASIQRRRRRAVATSAASEPFSAAFPAGERLATVPLPCVAIAVHSSALRDESGSAALEAAVAAGAGVVVLGADPDAPDASGALLYAAAGRALSLIGGRARLVLRDRADLAGAAGAGGLLLAREGLPVNVARGLLGAGAGALVGAEVGAAAEAERAAADGASFLVASALDGSDDPQAMLRELRSAQRGAASVPVLAAVPNAVAAEAAAAGAAPGSPLDGVLVPLSALGVGPDDVGGATARIAAALAASGRIEEKEGLGAAASSSSPSFGKGPSSSGARGGPLVSDAARAISEDLRALLLTCDDIVGRACPDLPERSLLANARRGLDSLFLIVVVGKSCAALAAPGRRFPPCPFSSFPLPLFSLSSRPLPSLPPPPPGEFNSGKSSILNALLGTPKGSPHHLPTGVLPTTNEVSVIRHPDASPDANSPDADAERDRLDGLFVREVPARLLRDVTVVDTPGTNVVLGRQQRLTEEFVPRADLILFALSADRPFAASERGFLEYVRRWGKRVVFVVNKMDLLESKEEKDQIVSFVAEQGRRLLAGDEGEGGFESGAAVDDDGSARPPVLAVSARLALRAKEAAGPGNAGETVDEVALAEDPNGDWAASGFGELESWLTAFLATAQPGDGTETDATAEALRARSVGGGGGGAVRLKLGTPLAVAGALIDAAARAAEARAAAADADLAGAADARAATAAFAEQLRRDSQAQADRAAAAVRGSSAAQIAAVDDVLRLGAWPEWTNYLVGTSSPADLPVARRLRGSLSLDESSDALVGGRLADAAGMAAEHTAFVADNCTRQSRRYDAWAFARTGRGDVAGVDDGAAASASAVASFPSPEARAVEDAVAALAGLQRDSVEGLEAGARDAVVTTVTAVGGAAAAAAVLTAVMQTGVEDLLSLLLCGGAAWAGFATLPLRRARVKEEAAAGPADAAADRVAAAMRAELEAGLLGMTLRVAGKTAPVEAQARAQRAEADAVLADVARARAAAEELRGRIARLDR